MPETSDNKQRQEMKTASRYRAVDGERLVVQQPGQVAVNVRTDNDLKDSRSGGEQNTA